MSLPSYISYLFSSQPTRTKRLLGELTGSAQLSPILNAAEHYGLQLATPYCGSMGEYQPFVIELERAGDFNTATEHIAQHPPGAHIVLSSRFGFASNLHHFIHELFHMWHDMHGLMLQPLFIQGEPPILLDAHSHITNVLFCEALAETEAIRASWRLKHAGKPQAWRGAMRSRDWGYLAKQFAHDINAGMDEIQASSRCFERWYEGGHRRFYEKRALKQYQQLVKNHTILPGNLRALDLEQHKQAVPNGAIAFLPNVKNPLFVAQIVKPEAENTAINDITIASAAYLWYINDTVN